MLRRWLSKLLGAEVSRGEIAELQRGLSIVYEVQQEHKKTLDRIERKVYRDIAKGNGEGAEVAVIPETKPAFDINTLGPGEEVPPGVEL